ncbi:MAG TPA: YbjN domain-containing protein [Polyangiaceae bacterium]
MNTPDVACERCNDEGRIPREVVVGTQGDSPVVAEGWLPCSCAAGDDEGTPCLACHGVGRTFVELSHALSVETAASWHECQQCEGTGTEPPQPLLGILERFFEDDGWAITKQPEHEIIWVGFEGNNGQWKCCAQAREEEQQVVFYSICPRRVEASMRAAMAEFITRANYGIVIGNFELDYSDGEVRFKTSIDVEDARLTPPLIHHVVYANLLMTDRYLPGVTAIIEGQSPQLALELVEGQPN